MKEFNGKIATIVLYFEGTFLAPELSEQAFNRSNASFDILATLKVIRSNGIQVRRIRKNTMGERKECRVVLRLVSSRNENYREQNPIEQLKQEQNEIMATACKIGNNDDESIFI